MQNDNIITLDKAQLHSSYFVINIDSFDKNQLFRLYDFGIVKGTKIKPVLKSVFKGTSAYLVKGSVLAIRDDDANNITVSLRR